MISDNPDDKMDITFEKFGIATLDQLTKITGLALKGTLNGKVTLSAITKTPNVDAHLNIDSLSMNNTPVGDVKIESGLDNEHNEADMQVSINHNGKETMNIAGFYSLAKDAGDNALNFNVKMNEAQVVIFDPFIRDLVSNPKGTISSDLKLTGPLTKPELNGTVTLDNTSVIVNYL